MSLNNHYRLRRAAQDAARDLRRDPTKSEKQFWRAIRTRSLLGYKFLRQHPILHDLTGRETYYIADFYCARLRLVVEIDGEIHCGQATADKQRDEILRLRGFAVVRFTNRMVQENLDGVLAELEIAVQQREKELAERRQEHRDEP